jgi:hypothetical protein
MTHPEHAAGFEPDLPRRPDALLPVVGQTTSLGFPIRLAAHEGATRLIQQRSLRFDFVAAGTSFETQAEPVDDGISLSIRARLGLLPFSVVSKQARQEVIDLLAAPPPGASAGVARGNQIVLDGTFSLPEKVTAVSLIAALTEWVMNAQPWLERIAQPLTMSGARQRAGA